MIITETQTKNLATRMNVGLVIWRENKPDAALAHFHSLLPEFESLGDTFLLAKLHNNIGISYKLKAEVAGDFHYLNHTLDEYEIVKNYLLRVDDLPAVAVVENNIADVKLMLSLTTEAHTHLNFAESILTDFAEHVLLAQALETRARVYLAEGDTECALEAINRSEALLQGCEAAYPVECRETEETKRLIEGVLARVEK